jgi:hypothetical protein
MKRLLPRIAVLAVAAAAVMCELNPQPLPPVEAASGDRDFFDGSAFGVDPDGAAKSLSEGGPAPMAPTGDADAGDGGASADADADAADDGPG